MKQEDGMDEKLKHSIYLMMLRIRKECCVDENEYYDKIMQGILLEIYHSGCTAQADADRVAVENLDQFGIGSAEIVVERSAALAALSAASIKGE
jgi:hypothetical protein